MTPINAVKAEGTHYHQINVIASPNQLKKVLGNEFENKAQENVKYLWTLENDFGDVVTIYDFKHPNRNNIDYAANLQHFHIGAFTQEAAERTQKEINKQLNN